MAANWIARIGESNNDDDDDDVDDDDDDGGLCDCGTQGKVALFTLFSFASQSEFVWESKGSAVCLSSGPSISRGMHDRMNWGRERVPPESVVSGQYHVCVCVCVCVRKYPVKKSGNITGNRAPHSPRKRYTESIVIIIIYRL